MTCTVTWLALTTSPSLFTPEEPIHLSIPPAARDSLGWAPSQEENPQHRSQERDFGQGRTLRLPTTGDGCTEPIPTTRLLALPLCLKHGCPRVVPQEHKASLKGCTSTPRLQDSIPSVPPPGPICAVGEQSQLRLLAVYFFFSCSRKTQTTA